MPFVTDYTPISAALALGGIAGAGRGIAEAKARQIAQQAQDLQMVQQNIANQMQARQFQQQQDAANHANDIQTGLAYAKLNQEGQQSQQELAQRQAESHARLIQEQAQLGQQQANHQESTREFEAQHKLASDAQQFSQGKYNKAQQDQEQKDRDVYSQIDKLATPGTDENDRLRTLYRANGRIQAPNTVNPAQSLSVVNTRIKAITDPLLGGPLEGHEDEYQKLSGIAQQIAQHIGGNALPPGSTGVAKGLPPGAQPTGQTSPQGLPIVQIKVQGHDAHAVVASTPEEISMVPAGEYFVLPTGQIAQKE